MAYGLVLCLSYARAAVGEYLLGAIIATEMCLFHAYGMWILAVLLERQDERRGR